jgi:dihydroflavonol-4-reductase
MATHLITGGSGFVGRHLAAELVARGERVRVLDVADPGDGPREVEFVQGSVLDPAALRTALDGVAHAYHLAAVAHLWSPDPGEFDRVNRQGTETLLRAAAEAGVRRVIHCSTEAVLFPKRPNGAAIDETSRPPLSDMPGPYTRSKRLAEDAALAAARDGLDVVIASPSVPIGPGDRNVTPPAAMLSLFLRRGPAFFLPCVLNFVDVRDVAAGLALAAERGRSGERYILGGENWTLRELLHRLGPASGRRVLAVPIPPALAMASAVAAEWAADRVTGLRPVATREGVRIARRSAPLDGGKARRELGYAPRPVEEALAEAVRWLSAETASTRLRRKPLAGRAEAGPVSR